jgi:uncharacterized protein (UPF0333 family)
MNKILCRIIFSIIFCIAKFSWAVDEYTNFQQFDKQFNINFGMNYTTLKNGANELAGVTTQNYGLEVERLYNNGIWFKVNGNIAVSSLNNQVNGLGAGQSIFSQNPNLGGINVKVGYAIGLIDNYLLLTPYGLVGRNANLTASTLYNNNNSNITNDFYYTSGVGGRLEYRINRVFDIYLDQLVGYNWDQSAPLNGIMPQNTMVYTTTLGAKFNIYKQLQLGVNGFYNIYQNMASLPLDNTGVSVYVPCDCGSYGGTISIGMTY